MRGYWISFGELCKRVPSKSPSTLRRYTRERLISSRQLKRGGRLEYNWHTVERELAVMESQGVNAHLVALVGYEGEKGEGSREKGPDLLRQEIAELRAIVTAIAQKVGAA